jgi:hypothetical protein
VEYQTIVGTKEAQTIERTARFPKNPGWHLNYHGKTQAKATSTKSRIVHTQSDLSVQAL